MRPTRHRSYTGALLRIEVTAYRSIDFYGPEDKAVSVAHQKKLRRLHTDRRRPNHRKITIEDESNKAEVYQNKMLPLESALNFPLILELKGTTAKEVTACYRKPMILQVHVSHPAFLTLKRNSPISKGSVLEQSAAEKLKSGDDRLVTIYKVTSFNGSIGIAN